MKQIHTYTVYHQSPMGVLQIESTDTHIVRLTLNCEWKENVGNLPKVMIDCLSQLDEYFAGKRTSFDLPLSTEGTHFQQTVWEELQNIPFGKTISYKQLAERVNNPRACRAVGTANGHNPICIIIPCHRVIAADGQLGGYSGGLQHKEYLLTLEQAQ